MERTGALAARLAGQYELRGEIGRGGMATVLLARDLRHDRDVAVKVMLPELGATIGAERFLREIRLLARLQHPHILPLFDSGHADGLLYFVMPFVEGDSLRARLDRDGAFGLEETVRLVRQVADALDYAHSRGVVHRDLKPENILITGGQAFLADFGVAHAPASAGTLTSVGMTLGTPAYMSPEQGLADGDVDGRSDVYSLGCVCHEMLAGDAPFQGATAIALIFKHVNSPPPPLVGGREALPSDVTAAVARALAKAQDDRFSTAGDFATALELAMVAARQPSTAELQLRAAQQRHEDRRRVLVLEFTNITRAADADWLSTGIAETVSSDLNKLAGVRVVGQEVAVRRRIEAVLEGRPVDADRAAELAVSVDAQWVVWGAFQKIGDRIRITPHFMNTSERTRFGGEKLDGYMDDIFTLQDRIVTALAEALRLELTRGEVESIGQPETRHLDAYEHYARGYRAYLRFGKESMKAAVGHFRAAIAIDPDYALAQAGLGITHGPTYIASGSKAVLDEGTQLLERAIALDPSIGEAYAWLAYMQFRQGRFDDATRSARHGVEHEPASDMSWYMLGCSHLCRAVVADEPAEMAPAIRALLRCVAINPSQLPAWLALGSIYLLRGQYSHATPAIERAMELETSGAALTFLGSLVQRAVLHLGVGELEPARALVTTAIERYTGADHVYAETMSAFAHVVRGCVAEREGRLEEAMEDFTRAIAIAEVNEHRIAIGAHWVRGRLGLARVFHRLGRSAEASAAVSEARELFTTRSRFVWTWIHGATDADVLYDIASTLAVLGRRADALGALGEAASGGWADATFLRHDPAFSELRDYPEVRDIATRAGDRVALPPPVGSGGL